MPSPLLPWSDNNVTPNYGSDTTRVSGLGRGAPIPTQVLNGFLYQCGVILDAIQRAFQWQNVTVSDAAGVLTAALNTNLITSQDQREVAYRMSVSPSPVIDMSNTGYRSGVLAGANFIKIFLDANAVAPTVINLTPGTKVNMLFQQSNVSAHTWSWPSQFKGFGAVSSVLGQFTLQKFIGTPDGNLRAVAPASYL